MERGSHLIERIYADFINNGYHVTDSIIGAFYTVYNTLGYGFPEKNYENAMLNLHSKQKSAKISENPLNPSDPRSIAVMVLVISVYMDSLV